MRTLDRAARTVAARKRRCLASVLLCSATLLLASAPAWSRTNESLADEVRSTEAAFARTMADRDLAAFATFVADEAIFVGGQRVLRGRGKVVEAWRSYFEAPEAPFSWEPGQVVVLDSGKLALSSGPVRDPGGKRVGTFNSVWRRERSGRWRIVLDSGCPRCDCGTAPASGNP
jgi:ketosteroid isomerase-like protein